MTVDVRVCAREELAPGQCRFVEHGTRRVAVFHATDALFAIDDVCPHRGGPLSEGYLEGYLVTCPWHGWQFDVRTGACDTVTNRDVRVYPVKVDENGVHVTLPDDPAPPA